MIYVLAYPVFDPETAERLHAFRARHEPDRAKLVAPHITLVFGVADAHLGVISDVLDTVSVQTQPVQVTFDRCVTKFDPFESKHKLFLLCGAGSQRITALHTGLYDGDHRSELSADHPFKPHMTIATCDQRADAEQIDLSQLGDLPIRAKVPALTLVRLEGGRLTELKMVPLQG